MTKHQTALAEALQKAGVRGDPLYIAATEILGRVDGNVNRALSPFMLRPDVHEVMREYLGAVAAEMKRLPDAAGHAKSDAQQGCAPAPRQTNDGEAGQLPPDAHDPGAPSPSPQRAAGGHGSDDIHVANAAPARPRSPQQSKVLSAAVRKSVFDRTLGSQIVLRTATRHSLMTLYRKGVVGQRVVEDLLALNWPDDVTPLPEVADEEAVERIMANGQAMLQHLGIAHA